MSRGIVMKRKTIGVLVGGITDDFTRLLCHGVIERAKTLDVNIVVIPGKFLDREYPETSDIYYEYQYRHCFPMLQMRIWTALLLHRVVLAALQPRSVSANL